MVSDYFISFPKLPLHTEIKAWKLRVLNLSHKYLHPKCHCRVAFSAPKERGLGWGMDGGQKRRHEVERRTFVSGPGRLKGTQCPAELESGPPMVTFGSLGYCQLPLERE